MAPKSSTVCQNLILISAALNLVSSGCLCQSGGGVFDFGENRYGERRGTWTPSEWLGLVLIVMVILTGLAFTIGLCYFVNKRESRRTYSNPMMARI